MLIKFTNVVLPVENRFQYLSCMIIQKQAILVLKKKLRLPDIFICIALPQLWSIIVSKIALFFRLFI